MNSLNFPPQNLPAWYICIQILLPPEWRLFFLYRKECFSTFALDPITSCAVKDFASWSIHAFLQQSHLTVHRIITIIIQICSNIFLSSHTCFFIYNLFQICPIFLFSFITKFLSTQTNYFYLLVFMPLFNTVRCASIPLLLVRSATVVRLPNPMDCFPTFLGFSAIFVKTNSLPIWCMVSSWLPRFFFLILDSVHKCWHFSISLFDFYLNSLLSYSIHLTPPGAPVSNKYPSLVFSHPFCFLKLKVII